MAILGGIPVAGKKAAAHKRGCNGGSSAVGRYAVHIKNNGRRERVVTRAPFRQIMPPCTRPV